MDVASLMYYFNYVQQSKAKRVNAHHIKRPHILFAKIMRHRFTIAMNDVEIIEFIFTRCYNLVAIFDCKIYSSFIYALDDPERLFLLWKVDA